MCSKVKPLLKKIIKRGHFEIYDHHVMVVLMVSPGPFFMPAVLIRFHCQAVIIVSLVTMHIFIHIRYRF